MAGKAAGDAFLFGPGRKKAPGRRAPGRGRGLLLHNDHSKGIGAAIDVFVDNGNSYAGDRVGVKTRSNGAESYLRTDQICGFRERGFEIRDIRRLEGDGGSIGNVGTQDVRQGSFGGFGKGIKPILVLSDLGFIKQGGDITAEFGNLIAEGDIIFISRSNV